jgi:hypothetical protein
MHEDIRHVGAAEKIAPILIELRQPTAAGKFDGNGFSVREWLYLHPSGYGRTPFKIRYGAPKPVSDA